MVESKVIRSCESVEVKISKEDPVFSVHDGEMPDNLDEMLPSDPFSPELSS